LIVGGGDGRDVVGQIIRGDVVGLMLYAKMLCGDACKLHLVIALCLEADRIGCDGAAALAQHADYGRAVGAARQKCSDAGTIQITFDGILDELPEVTRASFEVCVGRLFEVRPPPGAGVDVTAICDEARAWLKPQDILEDRAGAGITWKYR
jgi:hypothetical protein